MLTLPGRSARGWAKWWVYSEGLTCLLCERQWCDQCGPGLPGVFAATAAVPDIPRTHLSAVVTWLSCRSFYPLHEPSLTLKADEGRSCFASRRVSFEK